MSPRVYLKEGNYHVTLEKDIYCIETNMTTKINNKLPPGKYYVNSEGKIWEYLRISYDKKYNIYGLFTITNYDRNKYIAYLNKPICPCGKCGIEYESTTLE